MIVKKAISRIAAKDFHGELVTTSRHYRYFFGRTERCSTFRRCHYFSSVRRTDSVVTTSRRHVSTVDLAQPTIYALSTAPGRAAIAIIRISGPACLEIHHALCPDREAPRPRHATVRSLYEPLSEARPDSVLDSNALVLYFPGPQTATGEDVLELHVHGGPAVVKAVLAAIPECRLKYPRRRLGGSVIRYAEPGEFTRRAFLNDRLDLTQVEALSDILSATTEQQRRLSMRGTKGGLARVYEDWRQQLLYARGELEALIDFSEDQHFDESPADLYSSVARQVGVLKLALEAHERNAVRGEMLRNGITMSLLGAPNAGKSSLLNRIVGREAAIVSHEAGTTRDVVEVGLDIGGYLCRLGDTAGLRSQHEKAHPAVAEPPQGPRDRGERIGRVEEEGMRRAKDRAAESDVVIVVLSFEPEQEISNGRISVHLDPEVISTAAELVAKKNNVMVVINKSDLSSHDASLAAVRATQAALPGLDMTRIHLVSCKDADLALAPSRPRGTGTAVEDPGHVQAFLVGLIGFFGELTAAVIGPEPLDLDTNAIGGRTTTSHVDSSPWQDSLGASERHRILLEDSVRHLDLFLREVGGESGRGESANNDEETDVVIAAEHLRAAADCLAKITGRGEGGDVEEVLGIVFENFCVGK